MFNNNIVQKYDFHYPLVIFLMGPTASGKTKLAMALHKAKLKIKIISVDSALVYKGMDIGTAKPSSSELKCVPHKLIDICDPAKCYSIANFYHDVIFEINNIIKSGYIPLLVGGTMLYFKVLLTGLFNLPQTNQKIRDSLEYEAKQVGWINMYNKLKCIDPVISKKIHWNDHKRIIRALEVFFLSGKTKTELEQKRIYDNKLQFQYRVLQFAVIPCNKVNLYNRIEKRFYRMLEIGLENEVTILFNRTDLHQGIKSSISCVGYRQMWEYLSKKITYDDMVRKSIHATKKLVKQQFTWLRHWPNLVYLNNNDNVSTSVNTILSILSKIYLSNQTLFKN